ncbi:ABC transporter substrate-binding protein [Actinomadura keratinilytica]|uniref:ABC transporter substrate-binding protein n=1 Tax=Actinomadura keratinilytica TaxID=547461 RepID=UPI00361F336C
MRTLTVAATALALALTAAGCSGKATGGSSSDGVKTGPGVTDDKITVAALTDLTGPYAALGKGVTQAQKLYFDQLNAAGGVCGRKVELVVRDHGYDVQKAVAAYSEVAPGRRRCRRSSGRRSPTRCAPGWRPTTC